MQPASQSDAARITRYQTAKGYRIYSLEIDAFPALTVNVFVVVTGAPERPDYTALIDFGSERKACFQQLQSGITAVKEQYGEAIGLNTLDRLILTHAHPDHLSGLAQVRQYAPDTPLAAYVAAQEALERPEAARERSAAALRDVFAWQGVAEPLAQQWLKQAARALLPEPQPAATYLQHGGVLDQLFRVVHVPGHAADQMALRLDDVLLTADHLLLGNLPPLWPSRLRENLGIKPYLIGLARTNAEQGVRLSIPSHDGAIERQGERIEAVRKRLTDKAQRLYHLIEERPDMTLMQLTEALYQDVHPQRQRLFLNQVSALAEYMWQRNFLVQREDVATGAAYWTVNPDVEPSVY